MLKPKPLSLAVLVTALFLLAGRSAAQDATPDATPAVTTEMTAEPALEVTPEVTPETRMEFPGSGSFTVTLEVDNLQRVFHIYIPEMYSEADAPLPLIFVLHGAGGSGRWMASFTGFNDLAQAAGFIAVYPDGVNRGWNDGRSGDPRIAPVDDVGFVAYMIDTLSESLAIDPARVYAAGYSMGGMMAFRLGCDMPARIAAVASVASTFPEYLLDTCDDTAPLPVLVIQGTDDPVIPWIGYSGGYLSAARTLRYWGEHNNCEQASDLVIEPDRAPRDGTLLVRESWTECQDEADVQLYGLFHGGHTWPGRPFEPQFDLGRFSMEIDATEVIWEFFAAHPQ